MLQRRRPLWQRLLILALLGGSGTVLTVLILAITAAVLFQRPGFQQWFFRSMIVGNLRHVEDPPEQPRQPYTGPEAAAANLESAAALFRPTNIYTAHLRFTAEGWEAVQPKRVPPLREWLKPDGTILLRNPNAPRAGIAGVFGFEQPWSEADLQFGGVDLPRVAARFKGNGTFLHSLRGYRRPFKLDLDRHVEKRRLAGQTTLNLHNLAADRSFLSDTLGYAFFREAGVPAPRTAFARLFLTIDGRWERRPLGLYLVVENPDARWLEESLGAPGGALFKPVTPEPFKDLGDEWPPYAEIYDPKTRVTERQQEQLRGLARLVTQADDSAFADRVGEFLDLERTARFLAVEALLANYDSIFDNGQNYLLWFDPRTERFGFSPWDLDHAWGEFPAAGTRSQRERASLWHPWIGANRFLERLYGVESFRSLYRAELVRLLDTLFIPERLHRRIDELAAAIRPAVAGESEERVRRFESAVGDAAPPEPDQGPFFDEEKRPVHSLKRFITARAAEARAQLDGTSPGVILRRGR